MYLERFELSLPQPVRRIAAAMALTGLLAAGNAACSGPDGEHPEATAPPATIVLDAGSMPKPPDEADCPPASEEDKRIVKDLMQKAAEASSADERVTTVSPIQKEKQAADHQGVHLADRNELAKISTAKGYDTSRPFQFYFDTARKILGESGVTLDILDQQTAAAQAYPGQALTADELETKEVKGNLAALADNLGRLPVESIQAVGLRHIGLTHINPAAKPGESVAGYAQIAGAHDTFDMDPRIIDWRGSLHEFGHLTDAATCKSVPAMYSDTTFGALHGQTYFDQGGKPNGTIAIDLFMQHLGGAYDTAHMNLVNDPNGQSLLAEARTRQLGTIVVTTSGSFKNRVEDKAGVYSYLLDPTSYGPIADRRTPVVNDKSVELLARLYRLHPASVRYLTETAIYGSWYGG